MGPLLKHSSLHRSEKYGVLHSHLLENLISYVHRCGFLFSSLFGRGYEAHAIP